MARTFLPLLLPATILAVACGGGSSTGPNPPPPPPPPAPVVASVAVTPGADTLTAVGQTRQLTAVAKDASGAIITGKTFAWSSSAPATISVDPASGLATAVGNGQATLTASVDGKSGQAVLLVDQQVGTVEISPPSSGATALGTVTQFSAVAKDASGTVITGVKFLWVSSDPAVATVDSTGKVTARAPGIASITVAGRGVPATAVYTVTQLATQLAFTVLPAAAVEGRLLPGAVQVEVRDAGGALVAGARTAVSLAVGPNPFGGSLTGTTTVTSVGGIASFGNLSVDRAGQGYKVVATAASLRTVTSPAFDISLDWVKVDVGNAESCGITASGATYCWGFGTAGQIGDGASLSRSLPSRVITPPGVTFSQVSVGNPGPVCALTTSGAVYCWGTGFLGVPVTGFHATPILAALPAGVTLTMLSVGGQHTCGTSPGGVIYCWGPNSTHELGDGTTTTRNTPSPATPPAGLFFTSASAAGIASCATSSLGLGFCWGTNTVGQVGDGTIIQPTVPTPVVMPAGVSFLRVETSASNACGLSQAGALYCWGSNSVGQIGDGTTIQRHIPTAVLMPAGVTFTEFTMGGGWACGLDPAGVAWCWGTNGNGYLGDGTSDPHLTPQRVTMPPGETFVALSGDPSGHICAVAARGALYCWGFNGSGELGDGTLTNRLLPTRVAR